MHKTAYISLGGNLGDVPATFRAACAALTASPGIALDAASGVYRTEPQGDADQPWFCNQVVRLRVSLSMEPLELLRRLLLIETELGRVRDAARRFGPRAIDLDLLLFDTAVCAAEALILPHPRMGERAFVLVPLLELEPDLALPDGQKAADLLERLPYTLTGSVIRQKPVDAV